jgi:hypothetical protein
MGQPQRLTNGSPSIPFIKLGITFRPIDLKTHSINVCFFMPFSQFLADALLGETPWRKPLPKGEDRTASPFPFPLNKCKKSNVQASLDMA